MKQILSLLLFCCLVIAVSAQTRFNITGGNVVQSDNYLVLNNASLSNSGTFSGNGGTVTLLGDAATSLSAIGGTSVTTFYNLQINKSANNAQLDQSVNISNLLTFGSGLLDIQNNDLTILNTGSISGAGSNTYIKTSGTGFLLQTVPASDITFPIGNSAYNPLILNNAGTEDVYSTRVADEILEDGTSGSNITDYYVDRTWTVEEAVAGESDVTVTAQWNENEELTDFNRNEAYISHYDSEWSIHAPNNAMGSDPYTVSRSLISDFSPFSVSSKKLCPEITALDDPADVCEGFDFSLSATGLANMSSAINADQDYGIRFVAFSGVVEPADPYSGGMDLGTVDFGSLSGSDPNMIADFSNVGSALSPGDYLIYAVLSPAPADASCRPAQFIEFTVLQNVAITSQPAGTMFCPGDNYTLSVTATGSNLMYQWQHNGIDIGGETNATLSLSNLQTADAGNYSCIVSNECTSETSNSATLTEDNIAPTALCQNISINLDNAGIATITASQIDNGSSDACGTPMLSLDQDSFDCSHVGNNTVTLTVTDNSNNTSSCTATVEVLDNIMPMLNCPTDQAITTTTNGTGDCTGSYTIPDPLSDNCSGATWSVTFNGNANGNPADISNIADGADSGEITFELGTTTVFVSAIDASNNLTYPCNFTVTVTDNEAPALTCPANQTITTTSNGSGDCTGSYTILDPLSDNCSGAVWNITFSGNANGNPTDISNIADGTDSGIQTFELGTTTIELTATDAANNNAVSCNFTLTVTDDELPTLSCPANQTVTTTSNGSGDCTGSYTIADPLSDNCSGAVWNITFSGNTNGNPADISNIADGADSSVQTFELGTTNIELTATDAANNNAVSCNFTLTITDNENPTLSCPTNQTIATNSNGAGDCTGSYTIPDPLSDNCSDAIWNVAFSGNTNGNPADLTNLNDGASSGSIDFELGTTNIELTATDASNNAAANCSFTVTVVDNEPHSVTCPANQTILTSSNGAGDCTSGYIIADPIEDNCTSATWDAYFRNNPNGNPAHITGIADGVSSGEVDFQLGETRVSIWGNSPNFSTDSCFFFITVVDDELPTALCKNITVDLLASETYTLTAAEINNNSFDNCTSSVGLSIPATTFDCDDVNLTFNVELTVTDDSNNSSSCTAQVTVADPNLYCNQPPVAVCQDITVFTNENCEGVAVGVDFDGGSSDPDGDMMTFTVAPAGPYALGTTNVTVTVSDPYGAFDDCTATVTVVDNQKPTPVCQNHTVQLNTSGVGSITAADIDNESSDACGVASLSVSPSGFDCSNVGANTVTLTVTDNNGNISTCTATVTVQDNVAPQAICQNKTVQLDGSGNGSITTSDIDDGSNDACGIASLSLSQTDFDCSHVGTNTVTLTVTDNNNNVSSCIATVTVEDNVAPQAVCQNHTVQLDNSGLGSITIPQINNGSNDACGIASLSLSQTDFDCSHVGTNTVTLTVTDNNNNVSSCTATVTVEDNVAPQAICQDHTAQLGFFGTGSITAADIDDGSNDACGIAGLSVFPNTFDCSNVGANTVTLTVTDNNGNVNTCTATVTVEDNVPPQSLCQNKTVQLDDFGSGSITTADIDNGSNDACGIANMVLSQTNFGCEHVGPNTVTLTVTDVNGNSSSCSATVTVEDNVAPQASCQNHTVQLDDSGNGSITPADVDNGSNDACGIASLSVSPNTFDCSNVGTNTVTLTVTDNNNNVSSCTSTVTVEDNVAPQAICQNHTVQLDDSGNGSIIIEDINNGSNDACGIASLSLPETAFDCSHVGDNTVTLTVTDNNNNVSSCTSTVTVEDNVAPEALCINGKVKLDDFGNGSIMVAEVDAGSNDACGIASITLSPDTFDCSDLGGNAATLTVTDVNGNVSTCTSMILVRDLTPPTALCQDITATLDPEGNATITPADINNGSFDNCAINFMSLNVSEFDCDDLGDNTVTLAVYDSSNNYGSCTATVTVIEGNTLPTGWSHDDVGTSNGDAFFAPCDEEFTITASGFSTPLSDVQHMAYQELCGDVEVITQVISIDNPGWAGIEIRESLDSDSKAVQLKTQLGSFVRRVIRTTTGGYAITKQLFRIGHSWLKLVRTGNTFVGYTSPNGTNWYFAFQTSVIMSDCVYIGLFSESINPATVTTSVFDNVSINQLGNDGFYVPEITGAQNSIQNKLPLDFHLYPNPVDNLLNIDLNILSNPSMTIEIMDNNGKVFYFENMESDLSTLQIDLENLDIPAGTYLLSIRDGAKVVSKRFVKGE